LPKSWELTGVIAERDAKKEEYELPYSRIGKDYR